MHAGSSSNKLAALYPGDELPPATVTAYNPSTASENKIHDDDVARQFGFRGGLVPGVIVYAYMAIPLANAFGEAWLAHGEANVTLVHPAYEREQLRARATVQGVDDEREGRRITLDVWTENADGERCGTGTAIVSDAGSAPPPPLAVPDYLDLPASAMPNPRPELLLHTAPVGEVLAPLVLPTTIDTAREYAAMVEDGNPIFTTGSVYGPPLMHPGWLLSSCNSLFSQNYSFGPWIHTRSQIRYLGPALAGRTFTYHGRFEEAYEKRGHHYAVLDIFCVDDTGAPVTQVRHTAIFNIARRD